MFILSCRHTITIWFKMQIQFKWSIFPNCQDHCDVQSVPIVYAPITLSAPEPDIFLPDMETMWGCERRLRWWWTYRESSAEPESGPLGFTEVYRESQLNVHLFTCFPWLVSAKNKWTKSLFGFGSVIQILSICWCLMSDTELKNFFSYFGSFFPTQRSTVCCSAE